MCSTLWAPALSESFVSPIAFTGARGGGLSTVLILLEWGGTRFPAWSLIINPLLCFHGIPKCGNKWVSVSTSVSCAFLWALFLLFVLSYLIVFLVHLIAFFKLSLRWLFSNERQKGGVDLDKRRRTRRSRGKEKDNQETWEISTFSEKKVSNYISKFSVAKLSLFFNI